MCKNCHAPLTATQKIFCSHSCQLEFDYLEYIQQWLKGICTGSTTTGLVSRYVKRYAKEVADGACSICSLDSWLDEPMPLILDHINGDSSNNSPENLRMVCGNCDMLLPTYKSRNKGNGRHSRRQRYAEGKSY